MTKIRRFSHEMGEYGEQLRYQLLWIISEFKITDSESLLNREITVLKLLNSLTEETEDTSDILFFKNYRYLVDTVFHLIKWCAGTLNAQHSSSAELEAAKLKIQQFDLENYNYTEQFRNQIKEYQNGVFSLQKVGEVKENFEKLAKINWPFILSIEQDQFGFRRRVMSKEDENLQTEDKLFLVVALELFLHNEPWANPQILKPQIVYAINGRVEISNWPNEAVKLVFQPVSTHQSSLYELMIPECFKKTETEFNLCGQVVFKYPQHSFDESFAIKLLAYFVDANGFKFYPELIGYNQLIAKVLDPNSHFFLTGSPSMNELVMSIYTNLEKELPSVNLNEKNNFLRLLNGVLSYQGYCLQSGIYKEKMDIQENIFRDDMLRYLIGLDYLGLELIKEPHLAGGRIEICYRGIIVELKIEKKISDRQKLINKYGKQPIAYSSGNSMQLSILVVLDLTEKKNPPAAPHNNVMLITPELHGFENSKPPFPSKQVLVIFDGNTKKPSDYSR